MNTLAKILAKRIALQGPITIADYMAEALGHPKHGYYMTRNAFGADGDFITAPDISQMFGELIGLWCVEVWDRIGRPAPFNLVELGPGRGALMSDALRAAAVVPEFRDAAALHLIETSQRLRRVQRDALARRDIGWRDVSWHNGFHELPDGPCLIVANEFLDALPAHQFECTPQGWRERLVGLSKDGDSLQLALATGQTPAFSLSTAGSPAGLGDDDIGAATIGAIREIQPTAIALTRTIAERIGQAGGAALIIDYGYDGGAGDTLQAVRKHAFHDVLQTPGEADLTVHVDFAALRHAIGSAARSFGPIGQGEFLSELGIAVRAQMLMKSTTPAQAKDIAVAHHRLIGADEMGTLFKVFGVAPNGAAALPGFDQEVAP